MNKYALQAANCLAEHDIFLSSPSPLKDRIELLSDIRPTSHDHDGKKV